jgi:dTDP-4-amino-4,6-dideoxygalactose transaminase
MFMEHEVEGYNLPLDPVQAAIVRVKLPYLAEWTARRRAIAARYAQLLGDCGIGLPVFRPESAPTFYSYVIRVPDRDRIYHALRGQGIETGLHYVPPIHRQRVYQGTRLAQAQLPVTEQLAGELLGLPIAPELTDEEVVYVATAVREQMQTPRLQTLGYD